MVSEKKTAGLKERMLSAVTGSVITSVILTPMDVVRVRLQQQEMLPNCSCEIPTDVRAVTAGGSRGFKSAPYHVFWQDSCFHDVQCKSSTFKFNNTWDAFLKIAKFEGATALWRGISITLLMAAPANMVYFAGYESLRDRSPLSEPYPILNPIFCGGIARALAATSVAPLELLRTRLQSIPRSGPTVTTAMMMKDLIKETQIEVSNIGFKALFKGLEITLWRDIPFSAIYWGFYELYKRNSTIGKSRLDSDSHATHFLNSFIGGSFSGIVAALCTHPFDVGKTRMQICYINSTKSNDNTQQSKNMFKYLNTIRKTEGLSALYTGLMPRLFKVAPSCAIMISTYEVGKRLFAS
ncbi:LAMI_0F15214g1_1 [Lachancea mirantina]|uniref:LAMI_0F15214g1_1 n=1 Tax=Lachancea mirantina TaxID=1230905 RepID=A0A1G4K495_9SACH|nr:LAMI_0F15214g1_1 [Lachancea mirantina]